MSEEHIYSEVVNTPESLGVTPRFVLQHNALSRSIHNLSATAKKLTAMAMSLLPTDLSSLTAQFTFADFCKALGYTKSGESFQLFKRAIDECFENSLSIEMVSPKTGKKRWENYTWFTYSRLDEETGQAMMKFSPELAAVLLEMKRVYARINLPDMGKLQSKYALRIFEIAKSYESLEGKDGNRSQTWYFERTLPQIRELFQVPVDAYPETRDFRKFVIEQPVKEINSAGIGVEINTEGVKQGRKLASVRFNCGKTDRTVAPKQRRGKKGLVEPELFVPPESPEEVLQMKENQHLKELYPDEFAELYAVELAKPSFLPPENGLRRLAATATATAALRAKHGIVK